MKKPKCYPTDSITNQMAYGRYPMKKLLIATIVALLLPSTAFAGAAENIQACVKAIQVHAGQTVDEFDVSYEGNILFNSTADWPGIQCEVKFASVINLTVNRRQYVVDTFAGHDAKRTFNRIEQKTERAILTLESRIELLRQKLAAAEGRLRLPNQNLGAIERSIDSDINKATGG